MSAAKLLSRLVEAEEYSDWEVIQLLKYIYGAESGYDTASDRLWSDFMRIENRGYYVNALLQAEDEAAFNWYNTPLKQKAYANTMRVARSMLAKLV